MEPSCLRSGMCNVGAVEPLSILEDRRGFLKGDAVLGEVAGGLQRVPFEHELSIYKTKKES